MSANTYLKDEERQILESATVGIAAAMEANAVVALLLDKEI